MTSKTSQLTISELGHYAKQYARTLNLDAIEIAISEESGYSIEVRKQNLDALSYQHDQHVGLTVYKNQAKGQVSGCGLTKEVITRLIDKAADIAKYTQADPCSGLAPRELLCNRVKDLSLYHPWDISVDAAIEKAKQLEQLTLDQDPRIKQVEQAWLNKFEGEGIYFNSEMDVPLIQPKTNVSWGVSVIAEANNQMEQAYDYSAARDATDLLSAERIAKKAVDKAVSRLGAKSLSSRTAPVIFAPSVAKTLWGLLFSAISGRSIYQQSSFLTDHLGKAILPEGFSLGQDPFIQKAMGSGSFESDGVQTKAMNYIEDGILQSYVLSQYSANRLGLVTTGNCGGLYNASPQGPNDTFQNLVKKMNTGLLVTDFMGQGVDLSSGSFSKGINGFWIENGVIQFPVHHTSIAGNLQDIYKGIIAIANDDMDTKGSLRTGSLWLNQISISGM
jgi:PmbA protein